MKVIEEKGFSLIEMVVVVAIIGIILAIAIPGFIVMAPRMRLKSAARDIVSNMQLARAQALRDRKTYTIQFDTPGSKYTISTGGVAEKIVNLSEYPGVSFGSGNGRASGDPSAEDVSDGVTFKNNNITFDSNSTNDNTGGVYLKDSDNTTYSVICLSKAGGVETQKDSNGSGWE